MIWDRRRSARPYECRFDATEVFRVTFAVRGNVGQPRTGYVDIDDVEFYR